MIDGERRKLILFQISLYILGFPIVLGVVWCITGSITTKNIIAPLVTYSILTLISFYEEYKRQY